MRMPKDKSSRPNGWFVELFLGFLIVWEGKLWRWFKNIGRGFVFGHLNVTFIALIQKLVEPNTFSDYGSIDLFNTLHKLISKVLANRLNIVLSNHISLAQSSFLFNTQIHDVIRLP